jgi:hypothetical protein
MLPVNKKKFDRRAIRVLALFKLNIALLPELYFIRFFFLISNFVIMLGGVGEASGSCVKS